MYKFHYFVFMIVTLTLVFTGTIQEISMVIGRTIREQLSFLPEEFQVPFMLVVIVATAFSIMYDLIEKDEKSTDSKQK